jgi:hypothetical protein
MHPSMTPLDRTLWQETQPLLHGLESLDPLQAVQRVIPSTNSIALLATHLRHSRHYLTDAQGAPLATDSDSLPERGRGRR